MKPDHYLASSFLFVTPLVGEMGLVKYCRKSCEFPPKFGGFDFISYLYIMAEHKFYRKTLNSSYVVFPGENSRTM